MAASEDLEVDFVAFLLGNAGVTGEISDRLYPEEAIGDDVRGDRLPYGTYTRLHTNRNQRRIEDALDRHPVSIIELIFYGATKKAVRTVAKKTRQAIEGFGRGLMGSTRVQQMTVDGPQDDYVPPQSAQQGGTFAAILDVMIAQDETE